MASLDAAAELEELYFELKDAITNRGQTYADVQPLVAGIISLASFLPAEYELDGHRVRNGNVEETLIRPLIRNAALVAGAGKMRGGPISHERPLRTAGGSRAAHYTPGGGCYG